MKCATEDRSTGKGTGRHIAAFILYPANNYVMSAIADDVLTAARKDGA